MNVVVLINGREAIPVRAIPHMADSTVSADILVKGLLCTDHVNALHGLSAYELLEYEVCRKLLPVKWRRVAVALRALSDKLCRQEHDGELTHAEGTDKWKRESVKRLPSGVFVWKDEFFREHFKSYRRLSNEELAQSYRNGVEMNRELASASDDSYTAELMAAHGAPDNWRETFQAEIDEANEEGPFNPGYFCFYVPNTCAPKNTDTLSDVTFSPWIEPDEMLVVMEGFEHAPKAGPKSDEGQSAFVDGGDQHAPCTTIESPVPDRFARRCFEDGFNKVTREKAGERNFEARVADVKLFDERCIQLAISHQLRIADWTTLTGIGIGEHWSYLVTTEEVAFRNWTGQEISEASVDQQIDMHRDNEAAPLKFPCTPARLIQFIDAAPPGSHSFSVPDAFRQAVTEIEPTTDTPLPVPAESQEQTAPSGTSEKAAPEVTPADDDEQGEAWTPTEHNPRPVPRQQYQESEILRVISELGHEAQAIPKWKPGKPGVKAEIRAILTNFSDKVFTLAWERLRKDGRIQDGK